MEASVHNEGINAPLRANFDNSQSLSQERIQQPKFSSAINARNGMNSVNSHHEPPIAV